jgi:hypothetical protein
MRDHTFYHGAPLRHTFYHGLGHQFVTPAFSLALIGIVVAVAAVMLVLYRARQLAG